MLGLGVSPLELPRERRANGELARYTLAEYRDANSAWLTADGGQALCAGTEPHECPDRSARRIAALRRFARSVASVFL
jgi:hypothetical protein